VSENTLTTTRTASPIVSPTVTPTVSEFSWLAILSLLAALPLIVIRLKQRKIQL
jgi:hypothetical protein